MSMTSFHIALLIMNVVTVSLMLLDIFVTIFHSQAPRGSAKTILIITMSIGLLIRLFAMVLVMVMLRSNGVG